MRLYRDLLDQIMEGPVTGGMLDDDFYTLTMGQVIARHFPDVEVEFALTNRNQDAPLARELDVEELGRELDRLETQRFTRSEVHYVQGTDEYGQRMFGPDYIEHLRVLRRPPYHLSVLDSGHLDLRFPGRWDSNIHWEVPGLATIGGLRTRFALRRMTRFEREATVAEAVRRLDHKRRVLREHPEAIFTDFGTRRRAAYPWQLYLDAVLGEELPGQYLGTSNVESAMINDQLPMGTNAHQAVMVPAALCSDEPNPDAALLAVQQKVLELWWATYGHGLSIILPDTYGTQACLRDLTPQQWRDWKGFREDSSRDPLEYGDKLIQEYKARGIDPREKLYIASNGLNLDGVLAVGKRFHGRIRASSGWGTNLTNDWGLPTRSLVIKPLRARRIDGNWHPCVKISDNRAKAIGPREEIERYLRVFQYEGTYSHLQTV